MSLTSKYRAFIWDFDGTLFDTYPHTVRAYVETLAECGVAESADAIERLARVSLGDLDRYLNTKYVLPGDLFAEIIKRANALAIPLAVPFDGAHEFVSAVAAEGGKNMLYTHRDYAAIEMLRRGGLFYAFCDAVYDGDPDFAWKPSPDPILALLRRNGVDPSEAIMIGDREIDVESGNAAGIDSCLIMPYDMNADTSATYKCEDFAALRELLAEL